MAEEPTLEELKKIAERGAPEEYARELKKTITPEPEEAEALGITPTGGDRFGMAPGLKDPDALRAAIDEREPVLRGYPGEEDNPSPPAEVGTGHIGLGPAEKREDPPAEPEP
ncbi:MAG: hypothetical protein GX774_04055 [Armatimonadetes bacterium]|jgi:hypothetical protein|nr:hypothetical protein [Armatimonadota bacterium]